MKKLILSLFLIVSIVSLIAIAFTYNQADNEEKRLRSDIQYRSTIIAESLREAIEPNFINKSEKYFQSVVEKYANKERFAGLAIVDNKGNITAVSSTLPKEISESQKIVTDVMDSDKADGDFVKFKDKKMYVFAVPLHDDKSVVGALMIIQNAGYIDARLTEIWKTNLIRLFTQAFLISLACLLALRWIIYEPIRNLVETVKSARLNSSSQDSKSIPNFPFFQPLVRELSNIQRSLFEARSIASEEARLRLEKLDSPWTEQRLKVFIEEMLKGRTIFVVSNREPYIHTKNNGKISYYFPASGMATAIEPIMQACGGVWIAYGSGNADKLTVDKTDRIKVPPDESKYTLRRVWLTEKEENGYYYGFANEGIWPLCHIAHARPAFRKEDWEEYKKVNGKFAQIVLSEIKNFQRPIILIQDYHFALLPGMLKKAKNDATIGLFWHVPWPNSESFSICPWKKEILSGMLGADILGFHTQLYCNNFIDTISRELESLIDYEQFSISRNNHLTFVKPFPISIAFYNGYKYQSQNIEANFDRQKILNNLGIKTKFIGVGVDRLDYTKGILERLKAIEIFLEKYPSYQENFTFIQIAAPSRSKIKRYQDFVQEVEKEIERINSILGKNNWKPVIYLKRHHSHEEVNQYYKLANICLVTSLHDGMNLVAKEFIAARDDEKGVLILSQFAGASRELKDALIVNPYNGEEVADAIKKALEMAHSEQMKRIQRMRETIKNYNIYRWSAELLKTMGNLA